MAHRLGRAHNLAAFRTMQKFEIAVPNRAGRVGLRVLDGTRRAYVRAAEAADAELRRLVVRRCHLLLGAAQHG